MTANNKCRVLIAGAIALFVFTACSGKSDDTFAGPDSLLRFVPADTPYLLVGGDPLDDTFLDAIEPHADRILAAYRDVLRTAAGISAKADDEGHSEVMSSLLTELSPLFSMDGLEKAGIGRGAEMILYGNGLLPVVRVALSDPAAFEKTIAGLENAAGEALPVAKLGDGSYRYVEDDDVRIILGHFDGTAVLTMMPANFDDEQLRELLGLDLPARSMASTTIIPDIIKKYGFSNHYVGFVDTVRLADRVLDHPNELDAALFDAAEFDPAAVSEVCRKEIRDIAGIAPRAVFGYEEINLQRISNSFIVELREDLAHGLQGISAVVPGLGLDQGGMLTLGASVNLKALREFYARRLDAMEADPYKCEYFAELQAGVPKGREMLEQPLPPVAYGIRGFNAVIDNMDLAAVSAGVPPDPAKIDASVVVAIEDAASLVAMGMMFSPELAALNLQPDGNAIALDLPQLQAMATDAYAAMVDDALSIAVGPAARSRVTSVLGAESLTPPPSFALNMDASAYYDLVATGIMADDADAEEPMPPELKEAMQTVFTTLGDVFDRMSTVVRFTENGAVVDSVVTLQDL